MIRTYKQATELVDKYKSIVNLSIKLKEYTYSVVGKIREVRKMLPTIELKAYYKSLVNSKSVDTYNWEEAKREFILEAIQTYYITDPLSAGINIAYLPDKKVYYASVNRYHDRYAKKKTVVAKATGSTLDMAINSVYEVWLKVRSAV